MTEQPILAQITAGGTVPDAYLAVHPGAAAYYNGAQRSFLDKYGNEIFLAPMILGGVASVLAAGLEISGDRKSTSAGRSAGFALCLGAAHTEG